MTFENVTLLGLILAALPILIVLFLMVGFRWGGAIAGPFGWLPFSFPLFFWCAP